MALQIRRQTMNHTCRDNLLSFIILTGVLTSLVASIFTINNF